MYIALFALFFGLGCLLLVRGIRRKSLFQVVAGAIIGATTLAVSVLLNFWCEMLWFDSLGYSDRFWTAMFAKAGFFVLGGAIGWLVPYILLYPVSVRQKTFKLTAYAIGALIGSSWGTSNWDTLLKFIHRTDMGVVDPILKKDVGFYLFSLPFYDALYGLLLFLTIASIGADLVLLLVRVRDGEPTLDMPSDIDQMEPERYRPLFFTGGALLLVLAAGKFIDRYHLLYSSWGVVTGPGWTDVNVRLPAYSIMCGISAVLGILVLLPPTRAFLSRLMDRLGPGSRRSPLYKPGIGLVGFFLIWILVLSVAPYLFQRLLVEPNEITLELPYIEHNIRFTRLGFKLNDVEERKFSATGDFTPEMVTNNKNLFANIRLWDWRALEAVYRQFQEIRLYYEFVDVDIDRYRFDNQYGEVMVSARELNLSNLPPQSKTFVNQRFKYTHGNGITLTKVSEFTPQGLPNLLIKDIPPRSAFPELEVKQPRIYYGELAHGYAVVNSAEQEFDYPSGEENVYFSYDGKGGVVLNSVWRKFLFGSRFGGTKFFFSQYPTRESRILFHREIRSRVRTLAPFLRYDGDPYIVLAQGRLYWIMDAYTTSTYFPYSEPYLSEKPGAKQAGDGTGKPLFRDARFLKGANYVRNSVKVVVDAYNGTVNFYTFEPKDPLIQVWSAIFPGLLKSAEEMPPELRSHVRYPTDMLLAQGMVYAKYHMTDPRVFYNQEDLWVRATEKYYSRVQPVEPYYIMWEPPGSDSLEFILMLPFTPKDRQVLIGWIAGMCDGDNYGRFLSYNFPKEERVLGTQQVETKIDQDRFLSGQLTLWDQRGSNVIRGNVLVIPVEDTLIYVEPIYLRAETAAYPELRLVAVMHKDDLSYAESFDEALQGLFGKEERETPLGETVAGQPGKSFKSLVDTANGAFEDFLNSLGDKRFRDASTALENLQKSLKQLSRFSEGRDQE